MRIKSLTIENIKRVNATLDLGGDSLFITGPNMVGKTAILDALEIAFLGRHRIGKSPAALAKFASDPEGFLARVETDIGTISKTVLEIKKGTNKVRHTHGLEVPDYMIRPSSFFDMTKANQASTVAEILGNSMSAAQVLGIIEENLPESEGGIRLGGLLVKEHLAKFEDVDFDEPGAVGRVLSNLKRIKLDQDAIALVTEKSLQEEPPGEAIPGSVITELEVTLEDLKKARAEALVEISEAGKALGSWQSAQREIARLEAITAPGTGTDQENQEDLAELLHELRKEASTLNAALRESSGRIAALEELKNRVDGEGPCPICQNETPHWRANARQNLEAQIAQIDKDQDPIREQLLEIQKEGKILAAKVQTSTGREPYAKAQEKIEELRSMTKPKTSPEDLQAAQAERDEAFQKVNAQVAEANRTQEARRKYRKYQDQASIHRTAAQIAAQIAEKIDAKDREKSGHRIGEILDRSDMLIGDLLLGGLTWDQEGLAFIGPDGDRVDVDTWSGSEELLARTAWAIGLAPESPIKLVLLDEFGRLAWDLQTKVLTRLRKLVAEGTIDQFVVISSGPCPIDEGEGLQILEIAPPEERDPAEVKPTPAGQKTAQTKTSTQRKAKGKKASK